MAGLIANVTEMIRLFIDIAAVHPLSALLLLVGALLIGFSSAFFGFLALGGLVSPLIPDSPGRAPPR
ncbi:hypothetical protein [Haladaptatus salinisoli]|uniref:hypothetical protein n=1 Tax=Haladaptatus salinisoli TaxID=2884876 RepID=UPI001D09A629|nr:hypothetical protein [Haladaptatus salinisoli]